jgi:hypothetical protein
MLGLRQGLPTLLETLEILELGSPIILCQRGRITKTPNCRGRNDTLTFLTNFHII